MCVAYGAYGANNGERDRTHDVIKRMQAETCIQTGPHLTCVDATREELIEIAKNYWQSGIRKIVALRGDLPHGIEKPQSYTSDLLVLLKKLADFETVVAAYPEKYPKAPNSQFD